MVNISEYFRKNISKNEYYAYYFEYIKLLDEIDYKYFDDVELIDDFKKLLSPENEKNITLKLNEKFIMMCFYLLENDYYIEQFPDFLYSPDSKCALNDLMNKQFKKYILEKNKNAVVFDERKDLASKLIIRKKDYIISEEMNNMFIKISTRSASFMDMLVDEKLKELCNVIEYILKDDGKFIDLDYNECLDILNKDKIKEYKNKLNCFRHSSKDSLVERNSYNDFQKDVLIRYGIEFSKEYEFQFTDERDEYYIAKDILRYLRITNPDSLYKEDNSIFYKSKNDKPELLSLWLERCYRIVSNQEVKEYMKENIDVLIDYIRECARNNVFNEKELISKFNDNGIFLAIENDLKGSKIRGAFKVLNDKPAIYITKKYKRYADIYFALLYELSHCKSDFNRAKKGSIISTEDESIEDYEIKADNTAYNWMVNDREYNKLKYCYDVIDELDVIKCFYVYRLAKDGVISYKSKEYQENNKLIEE